MTIQEALKILHEPDRIGCNIIKANDKESCEYNLESQQALRMAIRSLEAWQNVKEDIKMYIEIESEFSSSSNSKEVKTIHQSNESIYQHCLGIICEEL